MASSPNLLPAITRAQYSIGAAGALILGWTLRGFYDLHLHTKSLDVLGIAVFTVIAISIVVKRFKKRGA